MDFFKDFSDLSNTPVYTKYNQSYDNKLKSKMSTGSNKGQDQDFDLLDNLMGKQQTKKTRKDIQLYSSHNIGLSPSNTFAKVPDKLYHQNSQSQINYNNLTKGGNKGSKKSILDELMSQDNKSHKSGATRTRQNQNNDYLKVNNKNNQIFTPNVSSRNGMRPPLKRKGQSRQNSLYNDDKIIQKSEIFGSIQDLDRISSTPKIPNRNQNRDRSQQSQLKFQLSPIKNSTQKPSPFQLQPPTQIIQKIIQVPQDNSSLLQQHKQQLKQLKQSYQKQINTLTDGYNKTIKELQLSKNKIINDYQKRIQYQNVKWQKTMQNQNDRIKALYQWQHKKKSENHQLQIHKLKSLIQIITKNQQKISTNFNSQQNSLQLNLKLKQLQKQKQRYQDNQNLLSIKARQLQSQTYELQISHKKQLQKQRQQKKKLFQYQTKLRKLQLQTKKQFLSQKQSLAQQMINHQLELNQSKQNIKHQQEKLNMERQLFQQQKSQYQLINNRILQDLKDRRKALEKDKQQLQNLQIQLYNKINTIQMMSAEKGINKNFSLNATKLNTMKRTQADRSISYYQQNHKQNFRNRSNSQLTDKILQTKTRYAQMEHEVRANSINKQDLKNQGPKIHLDKYMQRLGKDKLKLQKY